MSTAISNSHDFQLLYQALKKQQLQEQQQLVNLALQHQQLSQPLPLDKKAVGSPIRQRPASCRSPSECSSISSVTSSPGKISPQNLISVSEALNAMQSLTSQQSHRKLDRSFSEPVDSRPSKSSNINPSRYKTEMCRPFEESGHCKYGDKCQFAHGAHELRTLARHPKYKTDLCRTFHTIGICPYGPRCHFIHNEDERKLNQIIQQKQQQAVQAAQVAQHAAQLQQIHLSTQPIQRPKLVMSNLNIPPGFRDFLGSTADSPPDSPPDSIGSESPQSLSPTSGLGDHDHVFSPISSFGSSSLTPPPSLPFPSHVGYQPDSIGTAPTPIMTPLNVNTEPLLGSLASLLKQTCDNADTLYTPPSPPESLNGEELLQNLRLPIFSSLSED